MAVKRNIGFKEYKLQVCKQSAKTLLLLYHLYIITI
jgi:hypothetical protein